MGLERDESGNGIIANQLRILSSFHLLTTYVPHSQNMRKREKQTETASAAAEEKEKHTPSNVYLNFQEMRNFVLLILRLFIDMSTQLITQAAQCDTVSENVIE